MRNYLLCAALFVAVVLPATCQTANSANGQKLFLSFGCYSCHSFDGHGGAGARLVPMPLNQAGFIAFVRNAGRMPSYSSKVLPDDKLADIYAYVKSIPPSPDAKNIPLIQEILKQN